MPEIKDFFHEKVVYDNFGQYIWAVDSNRNHNKVADLRGWGTIQNLFKDKKGAIDFEAAALFQDSIGEFIAAAINEKLQRDAKT